MPERSRFARVDGTVLHYRFRPGSGRPIVFLNSLGTDSRIWDGVVDALPDDVPTLRSDQRGHGLSALGPAHSSADAGHAGAATVERLAEDALALMDLCGIDDALVCGVSIGGLVAQALALAHPSRVASLVLSNTGARIGDAALWRDRVEALEAGGLEPMADAVLGRWFPEAFRRERPDELEGYRTMLVRTPVAGYAAACHALGACDLRDRVGGIRAPTLCIAGTEDAATPPALVRELADAIPGARYAELGGAGHLPCIESPEAVAGYLVAMRRGLGRRA